MNTFTLNFIISNKKLYIKIERLSGTGLILNLKFLNSSFGLHENEMYRLEESEFVNDIKRLLPISLQGNTLELVFNQLGNCVSDHLKEYGRLLQADLVIYVAESVLIIENIACQIHNDKFSNEDKLEVFNALYSNIYSILPSEIKQEYHAGQK